MERLRGSRAIKILSGTAGLVGAARVWLFYVILLLLMFFGIGSAQELTDENLFFLLYLVRLSAFSYLLLTLMFQFLIRYTARPVAERIRSVAGFLLVLPVYLGESFLTAWLEGV